MNGKSRGTVGGIDRHDVDGADRLQCRKFRKRRIVGDVHDPIAGRRLRGGLHGGGRYIAGDRDWGYTSGWRRHCGRAHRTTCSRSNGWLRSNAFGLERAACGVRNGSRCSACRPHVVQRRCTGSARSGSSGSSARSRSGRACALHATFAFCLRLALIGCPTANAFADDSVGK